MTIEASFPKPIKSLFSSTLNYKHTLYLLPDHGEIQLGRDMAPYPIECSLFWLNARLNIFVKIGPKGLSLEEATTRGMLKFGKVELDEHSTTRDVWCMARALCMVLLGGIVEVTEVKTDPATGMKSFPILAWMDEEGRGTCPECKTQLPWRPAFIVNAVRRCPACRSAFIHRNGRLDVIPSKESDNR
jgi:hypothetical protein